MPSFKSIDELEAHLATRSYVTGYSLSADDKAAFTALTAAPSKAHPNTYRYGFAYIMIIEPFNFFFLVTP